MNAAVSLKTLTLRVPLPGFEGLLGIDPSVMIPLFTTSILKPGGRFTLKIPIPNDNRLKGLPFYFQALVTPLPGKAGFTNVWKDMVK